MWWLEVAALVGFAMLLGTGALALRRGQVRYGNRAGLTAWLVAGLLVLTVGVYVVASTA
jgi:hypothetical protein